MKAIKMINATASAKETGLVNKSIDIDGIEDSACCDVSAKICCVHRDMQMPAKVYVHPSALSRRFDYIPLCSMVVSRRDIATICEGV